MNLAAILVWLLTEYTGVKKLYKGYNADFIDIYVIPVAVVAKGNIYH